MGLHTARCGRDLVTTPATPERLADAIYFECKQVKILKEEVFKVWK